MVPTPSAAGEERGWPCPVWPVLGAPHPFLGVQVKCWRMPAPELPCTPAPSQKIQGEHRVSWAPAGLHTARLRVCGPLHCAWFKALPS